VVAQITEGTSFDKHGRPFRRRHVRRTLSVLIVLVAATSVVWIIALTRPDDVREPVACNPPPQPTDPAQPQPTDPAQPKLGEQVSRTTMMNVTPAILAQTKVRVLNASGHGGEAADTADKLRELGFAQPTAANDPMYGNTRLTCQGQIRFGEAGQAAAAAVWLVAPCTELFRDDRPDDSVDLVLGTDFTTLAHSDDIDAVLAGLRPDAEPSDPALLSKIHTNSC
jgi:hypothetical protein